MNADYRETLECIATPVMIVATVVGVALVVFMAGLHQGYDRGWCESRGGTYISDSTCNIDGKVVMVDGEE